MKTHSRQPTQIDQFTMENEFIERHASVNAAANATGVNQSNISKCVHGKLNQTGNYIWKRAKAVSKQPVNKLGLVYDEVKRVVEDYCILKAGYADIVTLWILGTYFLEEINVFPRLVVTAPAKGCGKSQVLKVIRALTPNSKITGTPTAAVLYRLDKAANPIRLIDEAEVWLKRSTDNTDILNLGFERGSVVERINQTTQQPEEFEIFMPIALAGIRIESVLEPATLSRGIVLHIQKEKGGRTADPVEMVKQYDSLRTKLATVIAPLKSLFSLGDVPAHEEPRTKQVWGALFGIAEMAGKVTEATTAFDIINENYVDDDLGLNLLRLIEEHLDDETLVKRELSTNGDEYLKTSSLFDLITADPSFKELDVELNQKQFTAMIKGFSVLQTKMRFTGSSSGVSALKVADIRKAIVHYLGA